MATVIFNHFPRYKGQMRDQVAEAVKETTEQIADDAQKAAAKLSGEMADSRLTEYEDDGLKGIAGFSDFKSVWNEYGTGAPGPTQAQPFVTPAAEAQREPYNQRIRRIRLR